MDDDEDNPWADYETGPFCPHWGDPGGCEAVCDTCGHKCRCCPDDCECKECMNE